MESINRTSSILRCWWVSYAHSFFVDTLINGVHIHIDMVAAYTLPVHIKRYTFHYFTPFMLCTRDTRHLAVQVVNLWPTSIAALVSLQSETLYLPHLTSLVSTASGT